MRFWKPPLRVKDYIAGEDALQEYAKGLLVSRTNIALEKFGDSLLTNP